MGRAVILVLDSFGIGSTDDAVRFGDAGADTLGGIARERAASSSGTNRAQRRRHAARPTMA